MVRNSLVETSDEIHHLCRTRGASLVQKHKAGSRKAWGELGEQAKESACGPTQRDKKGRLRVSTSYARSMPHPPVYGQTKKEPALSFPLSYLLTQAKDNAP